MLSKFPLILKQLRESKGWSRKDLASRMNISVSLIAKWESTGEDNRDPSTSQLIQLADLFDGVSIDYLLGRTDIPLTPTEEDILQNIERSQLKEIVEHYGIPIDGEQYSMEEIKAIINLAKMFNKLTH